MDDYQYKQSAVVAGHYWIMDGKRIIATTPFKHEAERIVRASKALRPEREMITDPAQIREMMGN